MHGSLAQAAASLAAISCSSACKTVMIASNSLCLSHFNCLIIYNLVYILIECSNVFKCAVAVTAPAVPTSPAVAPPWEAHFLSASHRQILQPLWEIQCVVAAQRYCRCSRCWSRPHLHPLLTALVVSLQLVPAAQDSWPLAMQCRYVSKEAALHYPSGHYSTLCPLPQSRRT